MTDFRFPGQDHEPRVVHSTAPTPPRPSPAPAPLPDIQRRLSSMKLAIEATTGRGWTPDVEALVAYASKIDDFVVGRKEITVSVGGGATRYDPTAAKK